MARHPRGASVAGRLHQLQLRHRSRSHRHILRLLDVNWCATLLHHCRKAKSTQEPREEYDEEPKDKETCTEGTNQPPQGIDDGNGLAATTRRARRKLCPFHAGTDVGLVQQEARKRQTRHDHRGCGGHTFWKTNIFMLAWSKCHREVMDWEVEKNGNSASSRPTAHVAASWFDLHFYNCNNG